MEIRFKLDPQLDEKLIRRIKDRANGGPITKAVYLLLIEWHALEDSRVSPQSSQEPGSVLEESGGEEAYLDEALASIEEAW